MTRPFTPKPLSGHNAILGPNSKREMTTREKIILMEGSKLNGSVFPPWTPPISSEFETKQFEDIGELSLSNVQLEIFQGWQRPTDVSTVSKGSGAWIPTMLAQKAIDLVQDVTTDCSVVASLCAVSARLASNQRDV